MNATLSTGETLRFPVPIRELTQFIVVYAVKSAEVARLLPADLRPLEATDGMGQMNLYWLEAADSGFGPFREFAVNFAVREPRTGSPAFHYHANPINTERGRVAGIEAWGHPTSLADVSFERDAGGLRSAVSENGRFMLSVAARPRPRAPMTTAGLLTTAGDYAARRRCNVYRFMQRARAAAREERAAVELRLGDHPLAQQIASLVGNRPPLYTLCYAGSTILSGPRFSDIDARKH